MVVMIPRQVAHRLLDRLAAFPAVALLGPRRSGKTTLAIALANESPRRCEYLDLELPSDRAKLREPELYLADHEQDLVILDEIHRAPGIFQTLRGIIDRRGRKGIRAGQFLLLGSATIDLLRQSGETLAGRIAYVELEPFSASEVGSLSTDSVEKLWVRGGFPDSFLAPSEANSFEWRRAFIQTYLERDIPALGPRIPATTLYRFWQMLAHGQGQLLNAARLAGSLGVSGQTVSRYLDILVDLLLVRRLPPWHSNANKRLVRSPKIYIRDSGLVHALLGIRDREELLGHPVLGSSWEGHVIENIVRSLPPEATVSFYRTTQGAELDLVIERGPKVRWAIEVKRSLENPKPAKGFYVACADVKATRRLVIYPGSERYRLDEETEVFPFASLAQHPLLSLA